MKELASSELWFITALVAIVTIIIAVSWLGVYAAFELFHRVHHGNLAALPVSEAVAEQWIAPGHADQPRGVVA